METVFLSLTKSELQDLIADTVTACLRHNQPPPQSSLCSGNATRRQAAEYLGISLPTLHQHTLSGTIKGNRIGRRILYRWADLDAAMNAIKTINR